MAVTPVVDDGTSVCNNVVLVEFRMSSHHGYAAVPMASRICAEVRVDPLGH